MTFGKVNHKVHFRQNEHLEFQFDLQSQQFKIRLVKKYSIGSLAVSYELKFRSGKLILGCSFSLKTQDCGFNTRHSTNIFNQRICHQSHRLCNVSELQVKITTGMTDFLYQSSLLIFQVTKSSVVRLRYSINQGQVDFKK